MLFVVVNMIRAALSASCTKSWYKFLQFCTTSYCRHWCRWISIDYDLWFDYYFFYIINNDAIDNSSFSLKVYNYAPKMKSAPKNLSLAEVIPFRLYFVVSCLLFPVFACASKNLMLMCDFTSKKEVPFCQICSNFTDIVVVVVVPHISVPLSDVCPLSVCPSVLNQTLPLS